MLIVHLSDIHFREADIATAQDPNHYLRTEILLDLAAQRARLGDADLVVVSGDIAFAGQPAEYRFAAEWLKLACEACGAPLRNVFVVPGNHDVDRKLAGDDMVQLIHREIKRAEDHELDPLIRKYLAPSSGAKTILYRALDAYNIFAQQFLCDVLPPDRTRVQQTFTLNDGSTLKLWGVNSSFVSSEHDKKMDLFVDPATFQIPRKVGAVNMMVTHHHPSWLRQQQRVDDHYAAVAPIQLFGHVHTNRIHRDERYVRFTASALHPDPTERAPEPGYNLTHLIRDPSERGVADVAYRLEAA